jgi:hypothetical protein
MGGIFFINQPVVPGVSDMGADVPGKNPTSDFFLICRQKGDPGVFIAMGLDNVRLFIGKDTSEKTIV